MFDQIAGETFPGRHPSVSEQWSRDAWLSDRRGHEPKVTAETPLTVDEVWALVHAGKAISVLPRFMVMTAVGDGVRAIPLVDVEPVDVAMARREDDQRPSSARSSRPGARFSAEADFGEPDDAAPGAEWA